MSQKLVLKFETVRVSVRTVHYIYMLVCYMFNVNTQRWKKKEGNECAKKMQQLWKSNQYHNIKPKVQDFSLLLSPSQTAIYTVHAICFLLFWAHWFIFAVGGVLNFQCSCSSCCSVIILHKHLWVFFALRRPFHPPLKIKNKKSVSVSVGSWKLKFKYKYNLKEF